MAILLKTEIRLYLVTWDLMIHKMFKNLKLLSTSEICLELGTAMSRAYPDCLPISAAIW